ncbi:MAG: carboxypeptidase, partial [Alphaproteobacteria bacterium]
GDVRRMPSVLVENHSLKPYRQRVFGTYVLLEQTLKTLAKDGASLKAAIKADRALRPATLDVNWTTTAEPVWRMDFKTIAGAKAASAASGGETMRWTGKAGDVVNIPVYGSEPGAHLQVAKAYWIPSTKADLIARLKAHGVVMETLKKQREVEVDMIRFAGFKIGAPSEGHYPTTATGMTHEKRKETFPAGSVRISTDQPLGVLAAMLLEPEGEDSFFAWGFFPEILQRVEYMEPYAIAPMADAMLAKDPTLKAEFEGKLKADPNFAASPLRRLQFFYERSPFYDDRYLLYPVGREVGP